MTRFKITSKKTGNSRGNLTLKEAQALTKMDLWEFSHALAEGHEKLIIEEEKKPRPARQVRSKSVKQRKLSTVIFSAIGVAILGLYLISAASYGLMSDEKRAAMKAAAAEQKTQQARLAAAREAEDCWGESDAFVSVAAQQEMKKHLKSPGTAKFPWFDNHVADAGNCQFIVTSYVDSQNGFGGVVRTDFIASVQITGDGQAKVEILTAAQR